MSIKTSDHFSFMQKISESVFIYRPTEVPPAPTENSDPDPQAILLLGWMDARDSHLAWYVHKYRTVFPRSSVVLVKARTAGLAFSSIGRKDVQPAVAPLRAILGDSRDSEPRLLIHTFSGGGSCSLYHLYGLYDPALPLHLTVFDSAPGVYTYEFATNVFTANLKNGPMKTLFAAPLAGMVAILSWLCIKVLGIEPDGQRMWGAAHNDPDKNHEARRTYLYGNVDKIVSAKAIEEHADAAAAKGFVVWRRELFDGSAHVAHARNDPERYWRVMKETWVGKALL